VVCDDAAMIIAVDANAVLGVGRLLGGREPDLRTPRAASRSPRAAERMTLAQPPRNSGSTDRQGTTARSPNASATTPPIARSPSMRIADESRTEGRRQKSAERSSMGWKDAAIRAAASRSSTSKGASRGETTRAPEGTLPRAQRRSRMTPITPR
jgi:hypothetical protein